jgi:hypothetical protein
VQQGQLNEQKLTTLQTKADQYAGAQYAGPRDGVFGVLLEKSFGGNLTFCTGGIFRKSGDGRDELVLAWLPRDDLIMLAYYLSGLISLPHNKGNDYLQQGVHKLTQRMSQHPFFLWSCANTNRLATTTFSFALVDTSCHCTAQLGQDSGLPHQIHSWPCCMLSRGPDHSEQSGVNAS